MIWGDGAQTRSFMYIDDCVKGIDTIMHCDELAPRRSTSGPPSWSPSTTWWALSRDIGGVKLTRRYDPTAPQGVAGRNSDNTMIQKVLGWEPNTSLNDGLAKTYALDRAAVRRSQGRKAHGELGPWRRSWARSSDPCHIAWRSQAVGSTSLLSPG